MLKAKRRQARRRYCAWLLLLLLLPFAHAGEDTAPVAIGVFSAYQSDVISHKINAFVDSIQQTLHRPVYVKTVGNPDSLRQLLEQSQSIVFLPAALLAPNQ